MCFDQILGAPESWSNTQHPESRPHNLQTIMNNHNKKHVFYFYALRNVNFFKYQRNKEESEQMCSKVFIYL